MLLPQFLELPEVFFRCNCCTCELGCELLDLPGKPIVLFLNFFILELDFKTIIFDSHTLFFFGFNHLIQMDNFLCLNLHFYFYVVKVLCTLLDLITHKFMVFDSLAPLHFSCE